MKTVVQLQARVLGHRSANVEDRLVSIELAEPRVTLAELVSAVVVAEVAAFEQRTHDRSMLHVLTERDLHDGRALGRVVSGGVEAGPAVDVDAAIDTALLAHVDGLFAVILDGEPIDSLDQLVDIQTGASILFLRLVPLAGG